MLCNVFRKITKSTKRVISRVRNAALRQKARMRRARQRTAPVMIGYRQIPNTAAGDEPTPPAEDVFPIQPQTARLDGLFRMSVAAGMMAAHQLPSALQFMSSDISVFVERLVF